MTTKQRHAYDHAWTQLAACCEKHGRMVSAGELAIEMGVSRNTAQKRLIEMLELKSILGHGRQRGNVMVWRYGVGNFRYSGKV